MYNILIHIHIYGYVHIHLIFLAVTAHSADSTLLASRIRKKNDMHPQAKPKRRIDTTESALKKLKKKCMALTLFRSKPNSDSLFGDFAVLGPYRFPALITRPLAPKPYAWWVMSSLTAS